MQEKTNISEYPAATPESVWAALQESDRQRKKNERFLTERLAETDQQLKENNRQMAESRTRFDQQMAESRTRFEQQMAESRIRFDQQTAESRTRFDQQMAESRAEFDRRMKESDVRYERRMKKFEEMNGGLSNSQGMFAEEYFFNSFENGQKDFFGEKFDRITKNILGVRCEDEYDILMINGKSVAIVEVKFRAREKDINKVLKKANTFRINYPEYGNHRVYLGLAALTFDKGIEDDCKDNGIAIVKQVGESVIITDEHLKVF